MPTTVYVWAEKIGDTIEEGDIRAEFEKFGAVAYVWVARKPPGFGFVEFEDTRDAEDAAKEMDGKEIRGETIMVQLNHYYNSDGFGGSCGFGGNGFGGGKGGDGVGEEGCGGGGGGGGKGDEGGASGMDCGDYGGADSGTHSLVRRSAPQLRLNEHLLLSIGSRSDSPHL